jgi:hypothetical protein
MLMASINGSEIAAEVWSTFTLNDCPQDLWEAIDADAAAKEHGSDFAFKNGPRVWLMDSISRSSGEAQSAIKSFGGLDMRLLAQVRLPADSVGSPTYVERFVDRRSVFSWEPGRMIHQLINPAGERYTLQAYCLAVDPVQHEGSLASLGGRLDLPQGWSFESTVLEEPFDIVTIDRHAAVIQDELQNTYSR